MFGIASDVFYLVFIRSVGVGFFIALIFGATILMRKFGLRNKIAVFFEDVLFFCIAAFVSFAFLLDANGGVPRGYIFFREAAGFFLFFLYKLPVK